MLASLTSNRIVPGFLADIVFRSGEQHVWTGPCDLVWNGNAYRGVGVLGKIGGIVEGTTVSADGSSVSLSGIDPALLSESLSDVQLGAPATIWFALFDAALNVLGTPYPLFVGTVDQPVIQLGVEDLTITLKLENRLINLQRAGMRRYTAADQNLYYPDDTFFDWVDILNDQALKWTA
jgi:hypothetical protein